jgi:L,D-peptidoglycan transpeptidase YkuD (ErfK/YbiS/YcfS/YnhG family)
MRRSVAIAGLLAASAALCLFTGTAVAAAPRPATSLPHDTTQLIRVVAPSYGATSARFTGYRKVGRRWVRALGPWTAEIGYNGMAPPGAKREGDGRTPSGTYGFEFDFGVWPNPGVAFPFRRAHSYDVWDDDPSSSRYNEWVNERRHNPGANPEPMDQLPAYGLGAVIAYNTARVPGLGSAIFLHVGTGDPTAGCVSLPVYRLRKTLLWLRPGDDPQIRMRVSF